MGFSVDTVDLTATAIAIRSAEHNVTTSDTTSNLPIFEELKVVGPWQYDHNWWHATEAPWPVWKRACMQ